MNDLVLKTLIATILLTGNVAFAESAREIKTLPPKIVPMIKDLKARVSTSTATSTKNSINKMVAKQIENRFQKMIDRFRATIEREEAIMTRIASRIEKIKSLGGETTEAEALIVDAKIQFDKAKMALANLTTEAENASAQIVTTTKDNLQGMKRVVQEIEKYLRAGHKDLEKAVGSLKGVSQLRNTTSTKNN